MAFRFKDTLPRELTDHVTEICGEKGEAWFERLPGVIAELETEWSIRVGNPFPGIEYNFVAEAADRDGVPVVLKIAPPFETIEIFAEAKYLRLHEGRGAVRLLAEDRRRKAIMIERAVPGKALYQHFDSDPMSCIAPAIDVLKAILQPAPADMSDVPTLRGWFDNFRAYRETEFPAALAEQALAIYDRLSRQPGRTFYIHGDYHPGNIVSGTREAFQIIDPKGIVGEFGYDIAVFLINLERWQHTNPDLKYLLAKAVSAFAAAFDISELEIREWVFAHMVIGAWWNFQDMPRLFDAELAMPAIWHL